MLIYIDIYTIDRNRTNGQTDANMTLQKVIAKKRRRKEKVWTIAQFFAGAENDLVVPPMSS